MYLSILISLTVFRTTWVVTAAPNDGICYDIDGDQTTGPFDLVCDSEAEVSFCCSPNMTCFSNGLCGANLTQFPEDLTPYYTSKCTDSSWNSSACPKICNNNETRQVTFYNVVLLKRIDRRLIFDALLVYHTLKTPYYEHD